MKEFNQIIREQREDRDLKQEDIAKLLKTNQQKISRLERGEFEPNLQDIKIYCKIFNLSADYMLGFTDTPKPLP